MQQERSARAFTRLCDSIFVTASRSMFSKPVRSTLHKPAFIRYPNQRVTVCGLIIVSRSHLQHNGQHMKFISICDRTGIVECEIFAAAYRLYCLNTIRYLVVQITGEVQPFGNDAGYTLDALRVERGRTIQSE